jgi:hypothetical protein
MAEFELALLLMPGTQTNCCKDRRGVRKRALSSCPVPCMEGPRAAPDQTSEHARIVCVRRRPHIWRDKGICERMQKSFCLPHHSRNIHPLHSMAASLLQLISPDPRDPSCMRHSFSSPSSGSCRHQRASARLEVDQPWFFVFAPDRCL